MTTDEPTPSPAARATPVLRVDRLRKRFAERLAVDGVSFDVYAGQLLGLLGPNGAGKSTTLSMVSGLLNPDEGAVQILGRTVDPRDAASRRAIGLVTQDLALVDGLSARANVELFGTLYGLDRSTARRRADAVLDDVGLADRAKDKPGSFSGGMKRRLHIACALAHDPALILLDEPTAGVDPQSRNAIFEVLQRLRAAGKALVYTTHYMEEVERLADRIVIVDHGRVVAADALAGMLRRLPASSKLIVDLDPPADAAERERQRSALSQPGVVELHGAAGRWTLSVNDLGAAAAAVCRSLLDHGLPLRALDSGRATLEDVFLQLTGRALRD